MKVVLEKAFLYDLARLLRDMSEFASRNRWNCICVGPQPCIYIPSLSLLLHGGSQIDTQMSTADARVTSFHCPCPFVHVLRNARNNETFGNGKHAPPEGMGRCESSMERDRVWQRQGSPYSTEANLDTWRFDVQQVRVSPVRLIEIENFSRSLPFKIMRLINKNMANGSGLSKLWDYYVSSLDNLKMKSSYLSRLGFTLSLIGVRVTRYRTWLFTF
jgi:hypothetical protein